jgi:hypothetical protein
MVGRLLTFTDVNLGQFAATNRLARTWLALHRSSTILAESSIAPVEPFGVCLTLTASWRRFRLT